MDKELTSFNKSNFTLCDYRKNDKCPPWTIQSTKMLHDSKKKTIYYDNALIKIYDIPVFYTLPGYPIQIPLLKEDPVFSLHLFKILETLEKGLQFHIFGQ